MAEWQDQGLQRDAREIGGHGVKRHEIKAAQFDDETWMALDVLARDRMMTFQELADEAFNDLLGKYHRPTNLKSALKQSAGTEAGVHAPATATRQRKRTKPGL